MLGDMHIIPVNGYDRPPADVTPLLDMLCVRLQGRSAHWTRGFFVIEFFVIALSASLFLLLLYITALLVLSIPLRT
ncbi:MAG: hypothetical protein ACXV6K_05695 [Halobacteriota archaeon]